MFGIAEGITALSNYFGGERQHDLNMQAARQAEFASAQQASISRDWQERMSNTGYQRATTDMKAAGLNPMLAYHQGPATSGPGATGQGFPSHSSKVESIPMTTAAQINNLNASTDKARAEAAEIRERTPTHGVERELTAHKSAEIRQSIAESSMRIEKIIEETGAAAASAAQSRQHTRNLAEAIPQIRQTVQLLKGQTGETQQRIHANMPEIERQLANLERLYKEMEMPGRQTDEAYKSTAMGTVLRAIGNALKDINPLGGVGVLLPSRRAPAKPTETERRTREHHGKP